MRVRDLIARLNEYDPNARVVICASAYEADQEMTHELHDEEILLAAKVGCTYRKDGETYFVKRGLGEGDNVVPEDYVVSLAGY